MHKANMDPVNQVQIAVAGPPDASGADQVAGTDPRTPMMEMAYDNVLHRVNSRRNS